MSDILLATHGGETAAGAARVAVLLAQRLGVALDVLAVLPPPPVIDAGFGPVFVLDDALDKEALQELRADADAQLRRCGWTGAASAECVEGIPARMIIAGAHAHHAGVIVVGLGPHHFLDRALGGETALRLAQTADTPILAVSGNATGLPHRALAGIDFSPTSIEAARLVGSWLTMGDVLSLASVAHTSERPRGPGDTSGRTTSALSDRLRHVAAELVVPEGVAVETVVLAGDPARVLLEFAERDHVDLIAVGSHGYGAWKRFLLGSVASKILRLATCSVLVVPLLHGKSEARVSRAASAEGQPSTTPAH